MEKIKRMHSTQAQILQTAIYLMEKKGYHTVTTKEIAKESGFSEMTLFRHFGSKKMLLEKAVEKYTSFSHILEKLENSLVYDLLIDLTMISHHYQKHLEKNKQVEIIAVQERNSNPFVLEKTSNSTKGLKNFLIEYFQEMGRRNKIAENDCELLAMNFIWLNLGFFYTKHFACEHIPNICTEQFVYEGVKKFVQGLEFQEERIPQLQYS